MEEVDLRSDTVTRPSQAMYEAMASAPVGDDVFGEDPTVAELEARGAAAVGKEAALFMPTGTMGNLVAVTTHCDGGGAFSEMIVGDRQHTYLYELGSVARVAGVHSWVLPNQADGTLDLDQVAAAIRDDDVHLPQSRLISLENTHNSCGGVPLPFGYVDRVGALAKSRGLKVHVDGARLFNAAVALGEPASALCRGADSVTFCLSKGLGAPAGSVLAGSHDFIRRARRARKALGGGMRQAGVLAACGIVCLDSMVHRLHEDHAMAQALAAGLAEIPQLSVDPSAVRTNILFFDVSDGKSEELVATLAADHGVKVGAYSTKTVRAVTHVDAPIAKLDYVLDAFRKSVKSVFA